MCVVGGYIYAVAGRDYHNDLTAVERYDPATNSWAYVAPLKREVRKPPEGPLPGSHSGGRARPRPRPFTRIFTQQALAPLHLKATSLGWLPLSTEPKVACSCPHHSLPSLVF